MKSKLGFKTKSKSTIVNSDFNSPALIINSVEELYYMTHVFPKVHILPLYLGGKKYKINGIKTLILSDFSDNTQNNLRRFLVTIMPNFFLCP